MVAFNSFVDGRFHIYLTDAEGSYQSRLSPEEPAFALVYDLAWSQENILPSKEINGL